MTATRSSLLIRVRDPRDAKSWGEFDALYRPLLIRYARQRGLDAESAEDVAQQCLTAVSRGIGQFAKQRSFRAWLRGMVDHKVADYLAQSARQQPSGASLPTAGDVVEPELWERTWNERILGALSGQLRIHFAEHTLRAFELYVLRDMRIEEIAGLLGMTPNQIYVAKSRVIRHIRDHYGELLESLYGVRR